MTEVEFNSEHLPTSSARLPCRACGGHSVDVFYTVRDVPTNSCILLDTEAEARNYPVGDINLGCCRHCGFIMNTAFEAEKTEYSARYEETQGFSPTFNRFHTALAQRLIDKHDLRGKTVMEIGCGKGEFLMLLADLGGNTGIGIDPGVNPDRISGLAADHMTFIPEFFSERHVDRQVNFLACKMTLEHIPNVAEFLATIRRSLKDQATTVFFQVPETLRILETCAFEDIYYEHCSYFTPGSLARAFRTAGFDVVDIAAEYDRQYLTLEARPLPKGAQAGQPVAAEEPLSKTRSLVETFDDRCSAHIQTWRDRILSAQRAGQTVAIWGSGSKAVSFMSTCDVHGAISAVTDVNPYRHNHFMPRSGHRILPTRDLQGIGPDVIVVMNRIYEDEIRKDLADMGLYPEILCL